uniref:PID domain-containing protein n=1 Tax=Clastoptera arizonana TaxID=38151 RepID=A0A1B6E078_9HEMI
MSEQDTSVLVTEELPQVFIVKYLGHAESKGLWGIKNTRQPVDALVTIAKQPDTILPLMKLTISKDGCTLYTENKTKFHPIDTISYGVQDLLYTRVFSMIIVKNITPYKMDQNPFECHAFICESRQMARKLTYCLATAFQEYSKQVRALGHFDHPKNKFAIDLRSPEEIEAEYKTRDSEA